MGKFISISRRYNDTPINDVSYEWYVSNQVIVCAVRVYCSRKLFGMNDKQYNDDESAIRAPNLDISNGHGSNVA